MISSVKAEYDIRLSEERKSDNSLSKDQFYAAAQILAAICVERIKDFINQRQPAKISSGGK